MSTPKKSAKRPTSVPAGPAADRATERTAEDGIWPRVTRELADDLAVDALVRDRAGKVPFDEVDRLKEAGLPALLTAPGPGGAGADWRTACGVVREISAADGSIGELLAHHCALAWTTRFLGPAAGPLDLGARAARERWLLAGSAEPPSPENGPGGGTGPAGTPASTGPVLTPAGGGAYVLHGRRAFASGVTVADRLVVAARCTQTGDLPLVLVDPAHPAVFTEPAAERVGQRLAGAGTVTFDRVPIAAGDVLGTLPHDEHAVAPYPTLAPLALRLLLVQVALGIAEGALAEARDVSRAGHAARGGDPFLLLAYGELATSAHTAAAVVERATDALAHGLLAGGALGVEERTDIAVLVAAAETVAHRAALDITTRILELVDPATESDPHGGGPGFDRFWRNARTLTAPVPPDHRLRDIGDHYLNGTHAGLTLPA
ncbi:acyl-CoA dehydrogenase family protein [Streptomyces sp. NPDC006339]|uniref:acyl-CoA dehydrogenase family protein n=1 Tax=Streptomyces sp. NPDC006339 TaxID=3156755 RepID=UPI0033BE05C1